MTDPQPTPSPEDDNDDLDELEVPEGADDALKEKIKKRNSELRNMRARMKAAEEKAKKYDELEESKKTETEKLVEQTKSLEDRATKAEADAMRFRVALRKGLSDTQAKRLVGFTEEELESDADDLLASFGGANPSKGDPPPGKPREDLRGGGDPTEEPIEMDPAKLADDIPRV